MLEILNIERTQAKKGFNRWLIPIASISIHLCIGSIYSWSIFNEPLTKILGTVGSSSQDWSLSGIVWVFSVAIVFVGVMSLSSSKWIEKAGPRKVAVYSAILWSLGFFVSYIGIKYHQLWILYLGYGFIGGCGIGLAYVSPVATLLRWFPDKRGLATGMAIMGFGGGAMIGGLMKRFFLEFYYKAPEKLGSIANVPLNIIDGVRYAKFSGKMTEVIVHNGQVFVVGTGDVGIAGTFLTLGIIYLVVMIGAGFIFRLPPTDTMPKGLKIVDNNNFVSKGSVLVEQAVKTPQFYLIWIVLCLNTSAGIGVLSIAKTMIAEIFGSSLPNIVDGAFASMYVVMISVFNMIGRLFWSSLSDYIGRKTTISIFFVLGFLLYITIPYTASSVMVNPSIMYLVMFYVATMIIFTMYGGGFSTIPAYIADVFGQKNMGAIYARCLTAWSVAGIVGPFVITKLRENSFKDAVYSLLEKISNDKFIEKFGVGKDKLQSLIDNNVITIDKLMEIAPVGTANPTATLYNTTMYVMAGLLVIGLIFNLLVVEVNSKHYEKIND